MMTDVIMNRKQAQAAGVTWYFTGKPCIYGHLVVRQASNGACKTCSSERGKRFYYNPKNIDSIREKAKLRMKDVIAKTDKDERNENRRKERADPVKGKVIREREKAYLANNPEKKIEKQRRQNERRRADPLKSFFHRASSLIRLTLKNGNWNKSKRTEVILGCSILEFKKMIERQFLPGMTWENKGEWHLDHIVPISTAKTQEEAEALSRAGNFRPIWAADNLAKSNSIVFLI